MESEVKSPINPIESFETDRLLAAYEQGRRDAEAEFRGLFDSFTHSLPPKVKEDRGYRAAEKWMTTVRSRLAVHQAPLKQQPPRNKKVRSKKNAVAQKDKQVKAWCGRCRLPHPKSKCYRLNRACFRCGSKEHYLKNCPILASMPSKGNQITGEGTSHEGRLIQPGQGTDQD